MNFPSNTLPSEFEESHGSTDLADAKPTVEDEDSGEDEDLELDRAGQRVWLCKVPKFLMEKWSQVSDEGVVLGRVRVYDEKDRDGNPKIAVILNEEATANAVAGPSSAASSSKPDVKGKGPIGRSAGLPTEYSLKLHNTASKNLFVFGEKEEDVIETGEEGHRKRRRITSMLGTVHHECGLTPSISGADAAASYQRIMRERQRKAAEPKRTVKVLDVDQGTANRLASGAGLGGVKLRVSNFVKTKAAVAKEAGDTRTARMPRNELLDLIFERFASADYWHLKALNEHVRQPQVYLKEVLGDVAQLVPRGPYNGMWTLRDEFKGGRATKVESTTEEKQEDEDDKSGVKVEEGVDTVGDDDEDDDDMEIIS